MSLVSDESNEGVDRLLCLLERVFAMALCLFLVLTVLGQVILTTPEGRYKYSRAERLEGVRLNVDACTENDSH
jgi:hypothetical protein